MKLEKEDKVLDRHLNGIAKVTSVNEPLIQLDWGLKGHGRPHAIQSKKSVKEPRFVKLGKDIRETDDVPYEGTTLWTDKTVESDEGRFDVEKVIVKGRNEKPVAFLVKQTSKHNEHLDENISREMYIDMATMQKEWSVVN